MSEANVMSPHSINIISIFRLYTIIQHRAGTYPVIDPTFYGPQSIVLAALEVDLASIVASVPVFWPMLTHGWDAIFVTQEVHVTRHHRRLSAGGAHDQFELGSSPSAFSPSRRSSRATRNTSDDDGGSLKLVIMDTDGKSRGSDTSRATTPTLLPPLPATTAERQRAYDRNDPYVRGRVYPLEGGGLMVSEAQVVSEGQRGFERNFREHFSGGGGLEGRLANTTTNSEGRTSEGRTSAEQRGSKEGQGERSWSLSVSRKSSQRF